MNRNATFYRKIVYIGAMVVLLIPLSLISRPSTSKDAGGVLSQMRDRYKLSQGNLGEIDPGGEAIKLATLGMRGIAANILWTNANHFKMTEQFDKMNATVKQITKLQPNFITVWEFQAHNLSYNTSVEYDDYRLRYHWVKKGLDFLMDGIRYNQESPRLLRALGTFTQQKIGRSDETAQFRRMFRDDKDFHRKLEPHINMDATLGQTPEGVEKPDNWLVARQWHLKGQDLVDNRGVPIQGQTPLLFHSSPAMTRMYYAQAIEEEGVLDEKARYAWRQAHDEWNQYGQREIPTTYGTLIRLNEKEAREQEAEAKLEALEQLAPGVRERLKKQRREDLSPEQREALDTPFEERTGEQFALANEAEGKVKVTHMDVADAAPVENRREARRLARQINQLQEEARIIGRYRDIVNFEYWRTRSESEQMIEAVRARKNLYEAQKLFRDADLIEAKKAYERAWDDWAAVFERYPSLLEDVSAEELVESIKRYRSLLVDQLGEEFPEDFKLQKLLDKYKHLDPDLIEVEAAGEATQGSSIENDEAPKS